MISIDQSLKNLVADYTLLALQAFFPEEARHIPPGATFTLIRQEQLKDRISDRFLELDMPILIEFPNGEREAIIICIEFNAADRKFLIRRHAKYAIELSELLDTTRVIPAAIFADDKTEVEDSFKLESDHGTYLAFRCLALRLKSLSAMDYFNSENLVERLCEPLMNYPAEMKREVTENACRGLEQLEQDRNRRRKYFEFIMLRASLNKQDLADFKERYVERSPFREDYMTIAEIIEEQGIEKGIGKGIGRGQVKAFVKLFEDGLLTAEETRVRLQDLLSRNEVSREVIDEALKKLK